MKTICRRVVKLLRDDEGVSAVEYAVLLTLIVVICLAAMATVGVEPR